MMELVSASVVGAVGVASVVGLLVVQVSWALAVLQVF